MNFLCKSICCSTFWLAIVLLSSRLNAQQTTYFQQKVDYAIQVQLDDKNHYLRGQISIQYTNNSPDTLSSIYMHLWPNGYKHTQTAFAKQLVDNDRLDFQFSKAIDRGFIDSLAFVIDGKKVTYEETIEQPDIALLALPQPILPNQTITIQTPFRVKLPSDFSRLAHLGQSYMICQWYPKPAVYDNEGWHPMPYLSNGEFYSEFGNFDVKITLPENYVLGATGELQTASEQAFLDKKAAESATKNFQQLAQNTIESDSFPTSSTNLKTVHYTAQKVHDFAWFADKRYHVLQSKVTLKSGKEVTTYALFNNYEADLWAEAPKYLNRAVTFYSDIVGEYPYSKAVAVQGIYQGADMEYPSITVIGAAGYDAALDNVITHEVGHNWFYGVLGSNERDNPWLDEGFNNYLDSRYMTKYYGYNTSTEYSAYVQQASHHRDQAITSDAATVSDFNYYVCAYAKPTLSFRYLQQYLGTPQMDSILKKYYQTWQYKHPQPKDVKALFEQEATKPVNWFFDHLIESTRQLDYAVTQHRCCNPKQQAQITIRNRGDFSAPIPIAVWQWDSNGQQTIVEEQWIEGLAPNQDTTIDMVATPQATYQLDIRNEIPDINRNNNSFRNYGLLRKGEPAKLKFLGDIYQAEKKRINLLPILGFNRYDGVMLGLAFYNLPIPRRKVEYSIMPLFSTFALAPSGMGEVQLNTFDKKNNRLSIGVRAKTFHKRWQQQTEERPYSFSERYAKITPYMEYEWAKPNDRSKTTHLLTMTHSLILEERGKENRTVTPTATTWTFDGKESSWRSTHRLLYDYTDKKATLPLAIKTMLEYANYNSFEDKEHYLKLTTTANFRFMYSPKWGVDLRLFAGGFLWHTDRQFGNFPLQLVANNRSDYHYDHHVVGRREFENALSNQVILTEGGFKTAIEPVVDNGSSNSFIFAINLTSDIPIQLPFGTKYVKLKPFLDLGYYNNTAPSVTIESAADELFFSGGIMLDIWNGAAGIYIPLIASENLNQKINSYSKSKFFNKITFSFDLSRLQVESVSKEFSAF